MSQSFRRTAVLAALVWVAMAATARVAPAAFVPPPPGAPSWWGQTTTPWYSYYRNNQGSVSLNSNEGTGFPISLTIAGDGRTVTIDMPNGYEVQLYKRFYFWIQGTTSDTTDPTFVSITGPNNVFPGHPAPATIVGTPGFKSDTDVAPSPNTWWVSYEGTATPQPDTVVFTFKMPVNSTITLWSVGEQCQPPPNIPEPANISLIVMASLAMFRRQR